MARKWYEIQRLRDLNRLRSLEATIKSCTEQLRALDEEADPELASKLQTKRRDAAIERANLQSKLQEV